MSGNSNRTTVTVDAARRRNPTFTPFMYWNNSGSIEVTIAESD